MKTAVITGASSGIGKEAAKRVLALGYKVIGVSRNKPKELLQNPDFTHIQADLSCEKEILRLCEQLQKQDVSILINAAGFGRFEPHEELSFTTISQMLQVNLAAAILLTNALLRSLKKNEGYLININSIEALRASKFAALYGATKAGLKAFGDALFEETRKSMLSVTNINPDMTKSGFYDNLRFEPGESENEALLASDIADVIEHILKMRKGAVVSEYTLRSLNFGIKKKKL